MAEKKIKYQLFAWEGLDKQGVKVTGVLPAENLTSAENELRGYGIEVTNLKVKQQLFSIGKMRAINAMDVVLFARQMSTLISAGIPLAQALETVGVGVEKMTMRAVILDLFKNISSGMTFTEALEKHPKTFNRLVVNLVKTGEVSGTLDVVLDHIANYLERSEVLKSRVKRAMFYPGIILVVTFMVAFVLLTFIVPKFSTLYSSFGADLPGPTQVVISLSNFMKVYWWVVIIGIVGTIMGLVFLKNHSEGFQLWLDKIAIKMPLFGALNRKSIIARIMRTLAITLGAGIPLVDGLSCVAEVAGNRVYAKAIDGVREDVTAGRKMFLAMSSTQLFPTLVLQMISVGEKTGSLESMLEKVSEYFDEQVNTTVDGMSTLIEPLMLVILGIVIGGFVISMYLPIFKLGTVI